MNICQPKYIQILIWNEGILPEPSLVQQTLQQWMDVTGQDHPAAGLNAPFHPPSTYVFDQCCPWGKQEGLPFPTKYKQQDMPQYILGHSWTNKKEFNSHLTSVYGRAYIKSPPCQHNTSNFTSRRNIFIALIQYVHAWIISCAICLIELLLSFFC